jgi:hypothetical protein
MVQNFTCQPNIPTDTLSLPSLETALMNHAGLVMDAFALDAATLNGDFDEARFLAMAVASNADVIGLRAVAQAAAHVAVALGPPGLPPGAGVGPCMVILADALDEADPRRGSDF